MINRLSVIISDDNMVGYIKLAKEEEEGLGEPEKPITCDDIFRFLKDKGVTFGVKKELVEKFAKRPIFGIKIEVARGVDPIDGMDGYVDYFVEKDSVYKPKYSEEGTIDYKNLDYFQQVKEGHLLCEIVKETDGTNGTNIFGAAVQAKKGRPAISPAGKNTLLSADGTMLTAAVSGVVKFKKDIVDINEVLQIRTDVDHSTGNIDFPGDVTIGGDITYGYSVTSGGNIIVRGMIEGARVEAAGDIHIGKGINGAGGEKIISKGSLRSRYIENADIYVGGDIVTDYIIDSDILCEGNIELSGRNELIVGGTTKLYGDLTAKMIGSENERPTKIEILGNATGDIKTIEAKKKEQMDYDESAAQIMEILRKYSRFGELYSEEIEPDKLNLLRQQYELIKKRVDELEIEIKKLEGEMSVKYSGAIICKKKLYQGVKIYFGNESFYFGLDNLDRCKILCHDGEIMKVGDGH